MCLGTAVVNLRQVLTSGFEPLTEPLELADEEGAVSGSAVDFDGMVFEDDAEMQEAEEESE